MMMWRQSNGKSAGRLFTRLMRGLSGHPGRNAARAAGGEAQAPHSPRHAAPAAKPAGIKPTLS